MVYFFKKAIFNPVFCCIFFTRGPYFFSLYFFFPENSLNLTHSLVSNNVFFFSGTGKKKYTIFTHSLDFGRNCHKSKLFQDKKKIRYLWDYLCFFFVEMGRTQLNWVFGFQLDLLEKNLTNLLVFTFTRFSPSVGTPFNLWIKLNTKNSTKRRLITFSPSAGTLFFKWIDWVRWRYGTTM